MTCFKSCFPNLLFILILTSSLPVLQAQILVHEEPRHRPVFQNKEIRILNVRVAPGDTSLYHMHTTPSFFIRLTNTITGSQVQGEEKRPANLRQGKYDSKIWHLQIIVFIGYGTLTKILFMSWMLNY